MKSKSILFVILLSGLMMFTYTGCETYVQVLPPPRPRPKQVLYVCPVHTKIVRNYPNHCPKCGRLLVMEDEIPQKKSKHDDTDKKHGPKEHGNSHKKDKERD